MKTDLELDVESAEAVKGIVSPSLDTDRKVSYNVKSGEKLRIEIETSSLGPLRGSTDTAFRLTMLANKLY